MENSEKIDAEFLNEYYETAKSLGYVKVEITYDDGSYYKGYQLDDKKHGPGIRVWPNQGQYAGFFKYDYCDGLGIKT
jgi:hypothetical protein